MIAQVGIGDLKCIKGITVFGSVNLGIQNAEAGGVKVAANSRKQVRCIRGIDQYLHAFIGG